MKFASSNRQQHRHRHAHPEQGENRMCRVMAKPKQ
jgi:hypothetical protein